MPFQGHINRFIELNETEIKYNVKTDKNSAPVQRTHTVTSAVVVVTVQSVLLLTKQSLKPLELRLLLSYKGYLVQLKVGTDWRRIDAECCHCSILSLIISGGFNGDTA